MSIDAAKVRELRQKTGAGIMDCKRALTEAVGDFQKAIELLRQQGLASAAKKAGRVAKDGLVTSYIHAGGKIGVLVEVNCETDFVARTDEFKELAKDIAMQIAASDPQFISIEDVPPEVLEKERAIYRVQALNSGKPERVIDQIVEGKLKRFYSEVCLLEQPFIKNLEIRLKDLIAQKIAKLGENIIVRRFTRYRLGEER